MNVSVRTTKGIECDNDGVALSVKNKQHQWPTRVTKKLQSLKKGNKNKDLIGKNNWVGVI